MLKDSLITIFRFLLKKKCPIITPDGTIPCPRLCEPEISNIPVTVAIETLEALKCSGQAAGDDYLLLGYFYSLEKKYEKSEANYLKALEFLTQELKKVRAAMEEPELGSTTKVRPILNAFFSLFNSN